MTSTEIDMAETAALDLLKLSAAGRTDIAIAYPFLSAGVRFLFHKLRVGIANGDIVPDGEGGLVTKAWESDPRHALNSDGTFKNR